MTEKKTKRKTLSPWVRATIWHLVNKEHYTLKQVELMTGVKYGSVSNHAVGASAEKSKALAETYTKEGIDLTKDVKKIAGPPKQAWFAPEEPVDKVSDSTTRAKMLDKVLSMKRRKQAIAIDAAFDKHLEDNENLIWLTDSDFTKMMDAFRIAYVLSRRWKLPETKVEEVIEYPADIKPDIVDENGQEPSFVRKKLRDMQEKKLNETN